MRPRNGSSTTQGGWLPCCSGAPLASSTSPSAICRRVSAALCMAPALCHQRPTRMFQLPPFVLNGRLLYGDFLHYSGQRPPCPLSPATSTSSCPPPTAGPRARLPPRSRTMQPRRHTGDELCRPPPCTSCCRPSLPMRAPSPLLASTGSMSTSPGGPAGPEDLLGGPPLDGHLPA